MTLAFEGITAGYGRLNVLSEVSFGVGRGTCAALVGANGAGKTTLFRVAAGICRPRQGRVLLDGEEITTLRGYERVRRGLCLVPEGRGIFGSLSVRDNLALFSDSVAARDGVERAFAAFPDLRYREAQLAATLSGGEQQMLALSRAVIQRPSVVLLDEVSLGLAPRYVDAVFGFVEQLMDSGAAVIVVDQYVTRSLAVANTMHLLERGRVVFSGPPEDLPPDYFEGGYLGVN